MRISTVLILLMIGFTCHSQLQVSGLSPQSRISVITCGPGDELYASFGHSAFRVQDPMQGIDWIYNYGTFDFNTPNFYLKFARGKLLYRLSKEQFGDFLYTYQLENRWVEEQLLDLDQDERNRVFRLLETNYLPENRAYKYDFIIENCSTKIPEILNEALAPALEFSDSHLASSRSFRNLIRSYLRTNSWASLGIDLALGSVIDRSAKPEEYMFLPEYVLAQLNNSTYRSNNLVERQRNVLEQRMPRSSLYFTTSPLFWLGLLLLFTITITVIDLKNGTRSRWLDFVLFCCSGLLGLGIVFLWFFTDHTATAANLNILWALPTNVVAAFYVLRKSAIPDWMKTYVLLGLALILLAIVLWLFGVQLFSPLVTLILLMLVLRYGYLYLCLASVSKDS